MPSPRPAGTGSARHHRPRPSGAVLLWLLVPVLTMLVVWQQASMDRLVRRLEQARDTNRNLEGQVNALGLEANRLSSLEQVETRAERELGLRRPGTEQIVNMVFDSDAEDPGSFALGSMMGDATAAARRGSAPR